MTLLFTVSVVVLLSLVSEVCLSSTVDSEEHKLTFNKSPAEVQASDISSGGHQDVVAATIPHTLDLHICHTTFSYLV